MGPLVRQKNDTFLSLLGLLYQPDTFSIVCTFT